MGNTFYAGNVYLSIPTIEAEEITIQGDYKERTVTTSTNVWITMASTPVRSAR